MSSTNLLRQLTQGALDLLFPPQCVVCHTDGTLLCEACLAAFPPLHPPICQLCGRPVRSTGICQLCRRSKPLIDGIRSSILFDGPARESIHQFKYNNRPALAIPLAQPMADYWQAHPRSVDIITAVPLHVARQRERGYNQANLLAREFGRLIDRPVATGLLRRTRHTPAQVGLNAAERRANVAGAFCCTDSLKPFDLEGRHILLVDDVCTTGATLEACSVALKAAGAGAVWGLTLARAL